ncbi:MAG: hypothetical protein ACE5LH_06290 [Fidelibacterota bacterium]
MLNKWASIGLGIVLPWSILLSQTVRLTPTPGFNRFITYYVSSVDINTGASDVQLFSYLLECVDCPLVGNEYADSILLDIEFKISMKSPALGIPDEETILRLRTSEPVVMRAPISLDSRDFSAGDLSFFDVNGNPVDIRVRMEEQLEFERFEDMFSVILQSGRLPDGIYRFRLVIDVEGGTGDVVEEVINVTTQTTLQLTSPGGVFENLDQSEIYTLFPVFQWESEMFSPAWIDNCPECGFFIRVAEFRCQDHATPEEAIEEVTVLPLDQTLGWQLVGDENGDGVWEPEEVTGNQLSYMYPTTGAVDLIAGSIYVWQIQKRISTTEGLEVINSPIYAFQIKETTVDPVVQALEEILPEEVLESYLTPCGPLTGYRPSGTLKLDGLEVDPAALNELVEQFRQGTRTLISTEVR